MKRLGISVALVLCCMCLVHNACQRVSREDTQVCSNGVVNSVFDLDGIPLVPSHLNADITATDSLLLPQDSLYLSICAHLGFSNPAITVLGYYDIADKRLVKMHLEDMQHNQLYVLLFGADGQMLDTVSTNEPVKGDQLGEEDGVPVEWHYYSNFYFTDMLEMRTTTCDLKVHKDHTDTLFCGRYSRTYQIVGDKFVACGTDSVITGERY